MEEEDERDIVDVTNFIICICFKSTPSLTPSAAKSVSPPGHCISHYNILI